MMELAGIRVGNSIYEAKYNDEYDCMVAGYKESLFKTEQIGRKQINEYNIYIKFGCTPIDII